MKYITFKDLENKKESGTIRQHSRRITKKNDQF